MIHSDRDISGSLVQGEQPSLEPTGATVVDVGSGFGALVIHSSPERAYLEVEICPLGKGNERTHVYILPRSVGTDVIYAGVFPSLRSGAYTVFSSEGRAEHTVFIEDGKVTEHRWA
ncbi:hypothetical protein SAMN02745225_02112 [Ferrithrix thermotolerans DSM 19514]|uniref:Uncharacterized protein n=1 Tax=Ferrithrix thermotolerans DSM 19514 TaxID=1121881 RepID=A0A1M4XS43_9ACTN|nr:hypothetical protein [Ferrithrix thermotolerans]SHE96186.1 hypothetical protein SAMN02745225_02112 [Ferrithrix thermotolerans DSM 19514]